MIGRVQLEWFHYYYYIFFFCCRFPGIAFQQSAGDGKCQHYCSARREKWKIRREVSSGISIPPLKTLTYEPPTYKKKHDKIPVVNWTCDQLATTINIHAQKGNKTKAQSHFQVLPLPLDFRCHLPPKGECNIEICQNLGLLCIMRHQQTSSYCFVHVVRTIIHRDALSLDANTLNGGVGARGIFELGLNEQIIKSPF